MAGSPRNSIGNVRYDMDITYPEHLSRLNRHLIQEVCKNPHRHRRNTRPRNRYRTQPVTFDEIQEVDEENSLMEDKGSVEPMSSSLQEDFDLSLYKFQRVCGSRRTKPKPTATEGNKAPDRVNGEQTPQSKSLEMLRRTDQAREGSI